MKRDVTKRPPVPHWVLSNALSELKETKKKRTEKVNLLKSIINPGLFDVHKRSLFFPVVAHLILGGRWETCGVSGCMTLDSHAQIFMTGLTHLHGLEFLMKESKIYFFCWSENNKMSKRNTGLYF